MLGGGDPGDSDAIEEVKLSLSQELCVASVSVRGLEVESVLSIGSAEPIYIHIMSFFACGKLSGGNNVHRIITRDSSSDLRNGLGRCHSDDDYSLDGSSSRSSSLITLHKANCTGTRIKHSTRSWWNE